MPHLGLTGHTVDTLYSYACKPFALSLYLHALTYLPRPPSCLGPRCATLHGYERHLERTRRLMEAVEKVQDTGGWKWASWPLRSAAWRRVTWVPTFTHGTGKGELLSRSLA